MLSWIWPGWIFPPQSEGIRRGRRESRRREARRSLVERARSHIARPFPRDYFAMYTMIDAIGARTGAAPRARPTPTAFVPSCVSISTPASGFANLPELRPFAVATTAVWRSPRAIASRARRDPSTSPRPWPPPPPPPTPRSSCPWRGRARGRRGAADEVRRGDGGSRERSSRRGAFPRRTRPLPSLHSPAPRTHRDQPRPRVREPSNRRTNPRPTRRAPPPTHPPDISQYGEFPLTGLLKLLEHPAVDEALHAAEHKEGSVDEADKISRAHAFFERTATRAWTDRATSSTPLTRFSRV